jgi:hypothetical protein
MGVRNCAELGENLQKIVKRLLANDELVKLLYYEQDDPMSQPALSAEMKAQEVFEKLIKTVPRVGTKDTAKSVIVVYVQKAGKLSGNKEFRNVRVLVDVIVPLTQWYIRDANFRPFAILGQVQSSLDDKTVNGLGKIQGGDFELNFVTDDVICY